MHMATRAAYDDRMPSMQVVSIREPGGPESLVVETRPLPQLRDGEVLVQVRAAGVNRPDVLQRLGRYPLPPDADPLPGLEIAGTVVDAAAGVHGWRPGDEVMALTHGGGYAEYCRVHATHCLPVPATLSMLQAAAVPETFFTVYYNLFMRGHLQDGETLLLHGGSSGIGSTAIQLAREFGATVITTAGSDEKCAFCEKLGAALAINYKTTDWQQAVLEFSADRGVDVVLDMVAGPYMQRNIDLLARDGRYLIIAFLQGPTAALDLRAVLGKRLTITGSTLRPQTIAEKAAIAMRLREEVMPLLESGAVAPIIDSVFPLAAAGDAHKLMESSRHMGKIVLDVAATAPV
ncbi:MAG: NAD(P)H-quinone oxidoreductase [Gammaproteobacteria bacterium]|nr:MAG: NAD(P)H-quinone oxidoreductase [Gammaproteobacteria bacterium]